MGLRGPQPKGKVKIEWSADFAYAIGLIVTDGNLAQYKSRITLVSIDLEQIENFKKCLKIDTKISLHHSGSSSNQAYRVQVCDVLFYEFLKSIGIFPQKSKTIHEVIIPDEYFFDFVRGCFDGDGCIYSYWDPRWKSSFMFYLTFVSASQKHILWLQSKIFEKIAILGHITKSGSSPCYQLKYAKKESLILLKEMYHKQNIPYLSRKKLKIDTILGIVGKSKEKTLLAK